MTALCTALTGGCGRHPQACVLSANLNPGSNRSACRPCRRCMLATSSRCALRLVRQPFLHRCYGGLPVANAQHAFDVVGNCRTSAAVSSLYT